MFVLVLLASSSFKQVCNVVAVYSECAVAYARHSVEIEHLGIFIAISIPIKISQYFFKNLVAPISRISKRVRTSKLVKNCENFIGVYLCKAKKTPCITFSIA